MAAKHVYQFLSVRYQVHRVALRVCTAGEIPQRRATASQLGGTVKLVFQPAEDRTGRPLL